MHIDATNPGGNKLGTGLTEAQMAQAVARSGYPLQTEVALALLAREFEVQEEWSYADRDTDKLRAIDLMATKRLSDATDQAVPNIALIIEGKRAELPYVFFRTATNRELPDFPRVYGLTSDDFNLASKEFSTSIFISKALGLEGVSYVKDGPPVAAAFARAERKGQEISLSGEDPFNSIVMPLVNAMEQAFKYFTWFGHGRDFRLVTLALGICVMEAPMLLADDRGQPRKLSLTPWVRIARQEVVPDAEQGERKLRFYAIDVVHEDYLGVFLDKHISALADTFSKRVRKKKNVLNRGGGSVQDIRHYDWTDIG